MVIPWHDANPDAETMQVIDNALLQPIFDDDAARL